MDREVLKKAFDLKTQLINYLDSYMERNFKDYEDHPMILTIAVAIAYQDLLDVNKTTMDKEEVDKFYGEIRKITEKVSKNWLEFLGE